MRSTNFEFLRAAQPKLADDAAAIEKLLHESPTQAINLLRSFAEHLLHAFVIARGRDGVLTIGDQGPRTIEFDQLLHECESKSLKWLLTPEQLRLFRQIKSEGNKAVHNAEYQAASPLKLLESAFQLAASIARALTWGSPSKPFREPPRGGEDVAELRRQRDEALREGAKQSVSLDHWIRRDSPPFAPKGTFVGREAFFREINAFIAANTHRVFLIEGQPGRGKTALLSHFIAEHLPTGIVPFYFFFEDGKDAIQTRGWIRHFYAGTLTKAGLTETDRSIEQVDPESLVRRLAARLHDAAKAQPDLRFLFILDAIDEAGTAKAHALALLGESLPSTVQVLVTARPNHVPENVRAVATVLNLELPDQINQHRNDGRLYLQQQVRTRHLNVSPAQLDEIGKLGDGNFLVLREICRDLPADEAQIDAHLRNLAELRRTGTALREELERRAWERLQRLDADDLHHIQQTFGLLTISQERLPERVIKNVLNLRKADFQKVLQHAGEYIATATIHSATSVDPHDESDADGLQVFRLYHATFAELVRRELKDELPAMQRRLADSCLKWWSSPKDNFERTYALRHLTQHLRDISDWPNLEAVLTDLQFIQARFEAGQGHDLLAEYEVILRQHPQQDKDYKRRLEQDAVLHQYVQDIVEYSRRCTAIRNRHERGECDDPLAEMAKLQFPDPPDTTQTIKDMRRAEERQKNPSAHPPKTKPTTFTRIRDFQQFLASRFQLLVEAPVATIDIARNYAKTGTVAEVARVLEPTRRNAVRLLQHNLPDAPDTYPFVIRSIDSVKSENGVIDALWMTPDAKYGVVGSECQRLGVYDLLTLQNNTANWIYLGLPQALSLDGQWTLLQKTAHYQIIDKNERCPLSLVNLTLGKVMGECDEIQTTGFHTTCNISPDGSLVVGLSDGMLVIWNPQSSKTKCLRFTDLGIDDDQFHPWQLVLCHSGMIAAIRDSRPDPKNRHQQLDMGRWTFIDLIDQELIAQVPYDEAREFWKALPGAKVLRSAARCSIATVTADPSLYIINVPNDDRGKEDAADSIQEAESKAAVRTVPRRFGDLNCISADGRYGFVARENSASIVDLVHGQIPDPKNHAESNWNDDRSSQVLISTHPDDAIKELLKELGVKISRDEPAPDLFSDLEVYRKIKIQTVGGCELVPLVSDLKRGPGGSDIWGLMPDGTPLLWSSSHEYIVGSKEHLENENTKAKAKAERDLLTRRIESDGIPPQETSQLQFPEQTIYLTDLVTGKRALFESLNKSIYDTLLGITVDGRGLMFSDNDKIGFWNIEQQGWMQVTRRCTDGCLGSGMNISPDGRHLVTIGYLGAGRQVVGLNNDSLWTLPRPRGDAVMRGEEELFSQDGRLLAEQTDDQTYLWSLSGRQCLGTDHGPLSGKGHPRLDKDGFVCDSNGRRTGLQIIDPNPGPAWVTGVRLFRIGFVNGDYLAPTGTTPIALTGGPIPGSFDPDITFKCRGCGTRSILPNSVIDTVDAIHRRHGIGPADSPVLMLPDEAWDDEPGLDFECPRCQQPHRSTPFYVDRRPR